MRGRVYKVKNFRTTQTKTKTKSYLYRQREDEYWGIIIRSEAKEEGEKGR